MIEQKKNIWECKVVAITTNGFVKTNGEAVMGRGTAFQAQERFPEIKKILGALITNSGNHVYYIGLFNGYHIFSFPVKPGFVTFDGANLVKHAINKYNIGDKVPGFLSKASPQIIERSAKELVSHPKARELINKGYKICIPRPGCGAGELDWDIVKPIIEKYLDDNFIVCHI